MDNMSLADIAAVTNSEGLGGGGAWILVLLFILIFGNGNRQDYGTYATAASQQEILFNNQFANLDNKMDRGFTSLGNGIADATFALNNSIKDGNAAVASAVVAEGRAMADKMAGLQTAIHAEGEATRNMIQQDRIRALEAQVSELKTQNMFCGIPRINPYGYQVVPNPTGCGCNCGNI